MPQVNLKTLDRLEASEARQRKEVSQNRAIRRAKHQAKICRQCGGDCQTLMGGIQAALKAGRQ